MRLCVYTLGCRLNQGESEAIADSFSRSGWTIVSEKSEADLYIVNTCTVTSKAEQKCRRMIRKFSKVAPVLVTGCYAQLNSDEIKALGDRIRIVSLEEKASLLSLAEKLVKERLDEIKLEESGPFDFGASLYHYHARSFLKVQTGCDNKCAYCRVRVARGPAQDLDADEAVRRALLLEKAGFHEITLTGVNLTMYDHNGDGLGALVQRLLDNLGPDMRLRLSSMEPDHVDDRLLSCFSDSRMQPHIHIPIQSASRKVLKRVNRFDDMDHVKEVVRIIRSMRDDPFIAADVITGLPAEGEKEFMETYDFFAEQRFSALHVFPFSPRPDTPLENAKDRVPEYLRDQRAARLRKLSKTLHGEYVQAQVGKTLEVIAERKVRGVWKGTTENYLPVVIENGEAVKRGELLKGKLVEPGKLLIL